MSWRRQFVLADYTGARFRVNPEDLEHFNGWEPLAYPPLADQWRAVPRCRVMECPRHGAVKLFGDVISCPECDVEDETASKLPPGDKKTIMDEFWATAKAQFDGKLPI